MSFLYNQNQVIMLQVVEIQTKNQNGEQLTAKDGRQYKIIRVTQEPEYRNGRKVIPTSRIGTKVTFDRDPNGRINPLYNMVEEGALMEGSIETVLTEPYFIPSQYGNDEDSEGRIGNWVNQYTAVVLEGENIYRLAANNGLDPVDKDGNPLDNNGRQLPSAQQVASDERITQSDQSKLDDDNPF